MVHVSLRSSASLDCLCLFKVSAVQVDPVDSRCVSGSGTGAHLLVPMAESCRRQKHVQIAWLVIDTMAGRHTRSCSGVPTHLC